MSESGFLKNESRGADYAPSNEPGSQGGLIAAVDPGSPAAAAGICAGMVVTHANGALLRDLIDWAWESDGACVELVGMVPQEIAQTQGETEAYEFEVELQRNSNESWGIEFSDCIFDGMRLCKNGCIFCFMSMLPSGMRNTLYLRDDDYRLSFLQGNFVTLTNTTDEDLARIIDYHISPLHISLHAVSPDVRARIIGKQAGRGLQALTRLLEAGIEVHAQIVLMPGINDGQELMKSIAWLEKYEGVLSCSIVPLGYTRFQKRFTSSFDSPHLASEVIDLLRPVQEKWRADRGSTRFYLADEFYLNAGRQLPPSEEYDDFEQYEDGIGMVRSFIDAFSALDFSLLDSCPAPAATYKVFTGAAFAKVLGQLVSGSPLTRFIEVIPVENHFFGGNVDVTGLLCGSDIVNAIMASRENTPDEDFVAIIPDVIFNACGYTLDDYTIKDLCSAAGVAVDVVSCEPQELIDVCVRHSNTPA